MDWFERVWQYREEELYPSLFGSKRRGIFTLESEMFTGIFKQESVDLRWLHYGVFEFYELVGITEAEATYARDHDGPELVELLRAQGAFPVTNPDRTSVVEVA